MPSNKTSLKFKHMSTNTTKLIFAMLKNEDLTKYIHYLGKYNPKDDRLPSILASDIKSNNFILTKFKEDILVDNKILIFFNPLKGRFSGNATSDDIYVMDIIIPYQYWFIEDTSELRAYSIAYEVAKSIDQKNIAGIGNVEIIDWESYKINNSFSGLSLMIKVTNSSLVEG